MKPRRSDVFWLIRSSAGRLEMRRRYTTRLWPLMARVGRIYRQTLGRRTRIVAVIGSVGKTTTMRTVSAALGVRVSRAALLNANSNAATGRAVVSIRPWRRHAVLEVAIARPGEMKIQAATVRPNVVVVTAIASDHWQSFHTLENTRNEKAEILRTLPENGVAIVNADDQHVRWMATQTKARVVLAGQAADAEIRATDVAIDWPHGMQLTLHAGGESRPMRIKLLGEHMVFPAIAAVAVALLEGISLDDAITRVEAVQPTPGRMMLMALDGGAHAIRDEFKAGEDSFGAALQTFADVPAPRRIAVIGEIAEETSRQAYRDLGAQAAFVDDVVFVGTSKNMSAFRVGARSAGFDPERIRRVRHAWEATDLLRGEVREGDAILIKGRWQQALGRVALELAGRDVRCRADPCPFKRMLCDLCPFLEQEFHGLRPDASGGPLEGEAV